MRTKDTTDSVLTTPGSLLSSSGRDTEVGRGGRKLYSEKKGKASGTTWLEAVSVGKLEVG